MNYYGISAFLFGAVFGGFLGVFIYRLPEGKPITTLRSICRMCGRPIRSYDHIPILSYFILGGRCRDCGRPISPRYAVIEALTGLLALALYLKYGFSLSFAANFLFCVALIAIAYIDLDHRIIPDIITLPGIPICFLAAVFILKMNWIDSLLGMLVGGGGFYAIAAGYRLLAKREGMGMGDVKFMAMLGAFLGWQSLIFVIFVSSVLGSLAGLSIILIEKKTMKYALPYGSFLSIGGISYIFWGCWALGILLPA